MDFIVKKKEGSKAQAAQTEVAPQKQFPEIIEQNTCLAILAMRDSAIKALGQIDEKAKEVDFRKADSMALATGIVTSISSAINAMEKFRKKVKEPFLEACQVIDKTFSPVSEAGKRINAAIKERQRQHLLAQQRVAMETAKVNPERAITQAIATTATVQTATGSSSSEKFWTFEVERPELVPEEFKTVDIKKIETAIAAGLREISGVRIFEDIKINYRAKGR